MRYEQITFQKKYLNNLDVVKELIACDQRLKNLTHDDNFNKLNHIKFSTFYDILNFIFPYNICVNDNNSIYIKKKLSIQKEVYNQFKISARTYTGLTQTKEYLNLLLIKYYHLRDDGYFITLNHPHYKELYFLNATTYHEFITTQYFTDSFLLEALQNLYKEYTQNKTINIFSQVMSAYTNVLYEEGFITKKQLEENLFFSKNKLLVEYEFIESILFLRYKLKKSNIEHNKIARIKAKHNKLLKEKYDNNIIKYIENKITFHYQNNDQDHPIYNKIALINFKNRLIMNNEEWNKFSNLITYIKNNNYTCQMVNNDLYIFDEEGDIFEILN